MLSQAQYGTSLCELGLAADRGYQKGARPGLQVMLEVLGLFIRQYRESACGDGEFDLYRGFIRAWQKQDTKPAVDFENCSFFRFVWVVLSLLHNPGYHKLPDILQQKLVEFECKLEAFASSRVHNCFFVVLSCIFQVKSLNLGAGATVGRRWLKESKGRVGCVLVCGQTTKTLGLGSKNNARWVARELSLNFGVPRSAAQKPGDKAYQDAPRTFPEGVREMALPALKAALFKKKIELVADWKSATFDHTEGNEQFAQVDAKLRSSGMAKAKATGGKANETHAAIFRGILYMMENCTDDALADKYAAILVDCLLPAAYGAYMVGFCPKKRILRQKELISNLSF